MSEELILSPSDPQWHERRREVYTASDMGVLFGIPGFGGRTLSDVWYEKRFGLVGDSSTASTRLGQRMEPLILDEAEVELQTKIIDRQMWCVDGQIGATLDGRCLSNGWPVEAKTSGLLWRPDEEWGDGGDEVPSAILLQVQAQILVTGADQAWVAAVIGGRGFVMYEVARHDGLISEMKRRTGEFIESLKTETPPVEPPQIETLKRLRRQPEKVLPRSDAIEELWSQFEEAKATAKASESEKERIQRLLLASLGDAEAAECTGGMLTYFEQTRKESVTAASTFRVLRFKKGK